MKLTPFRPLQTSNPELNRVQTHVKAPFDQLLDIPHLSGVLLENVNITTSATLLAHRLGRVPRGWFIVDRDADCRVWRTVAATDKFLSLQSSAAATISVWVF